MRRAHNLFCIKPNPQDTEPSLLTLYPRQVSWISRLHIIPRMAGFIVLAMIITLPFYVHAGLFSPFASSTMAPATVFDPEMIETGSSADIPVLSAVQNPNSKNARGGGDVVVEDGALVSTGPVGSDVISATKHISGEISVYVVRPGDSLSQIAEMFGVTSNTILWANDISRGQAIQPGETLVILPIVGVRHVVKTGDTIASIAKKYGGNADEIILYNQLASATDIKIGDTIIIPGGEIQYSHRRSATPVRASGSTHLTPSSTRGSGTRVGQVSKGCYGWLCDPVPGAIKTQGIHGYNAVDLGTPIGTPVHAVAAGTIIVSKGSGWNGGYGHYIVIKHSNGVQTLYAHLSRNDVIVGTHVTQGKVIGGSGSTGKSTGPHLHFEVRGDINPF